MIEFLKKIKNNIGKIIVYTLVLTFMLFLGYSLGTFQHSKSARIGYKLGLMSFCELEEVDRFKVCPLLRVHKEMVTGGAVTLYVCSERTAFMETNTLSKESVKLIEVALDKARGDGGHVRNVCSTEHGVMYKIIGVKNDQHSI